MHDPNNKNNPNPPHRRHYSVPVNSFDPNINLDDIFADFQPQTNQNQNQKRPSISQPKQAPKLPPKTGGSLSLQPTTHPIDKKHSQSVL